MTQDNAQIRLSELVFVCALAMFSNAVLLAMVVVVVVVIVIVIVIVVIVTGLPFVATIQQTSCMVS